MKAMRTNNVGAALFVVSALAGAGGAALVKNPAPLFAGVLLGLYLLFSIRVADQSIGRHELHQMVAEREMLGQELQRILDAKTNPWGITVQSVEVRDVQIPLALQDAMSREAQAERERRARTILGLAETEISENFAKAALTYQNDPVAVHLRAMNMLYEAIKERGSMVIVPSSAVETMGLGGTLATAVLGGAKAE
jgi:hypothetical protein